MKPTVKPFVLLSASFASFVFANLNQDPASDVPAEFSSAQVSDSVSAMMAKIRSGSLKLVYEPKQGYLKSVLKELGVSTTSQVLVFSKTSLQSNYISPRTPRAIYFNDHAYVGWIPNAPSLELIGIDPKVGPVFYTLSNRPSLKPAVARQTMECFQCHFSPLTGQVPGLMARSVYPGPDGVPRFAKGSFRTVASSPIEERWGGWYVSGSHGSQRHLGNEVVRGSEDSSTLDTAKGGNVVDLGRYFEVQQYPTAHSDIVALMLLEQQMTIQNAITKAAHLTRKAEKDGVDLLKFGFTPQHVEEEMHERIDHACEPIVKALLGSGEPNLTAAIKGTSGFTASFSQSSPADKAGRRLSELDLKTKLLKYSCSPMIYSASFDGLPSKAKAQIYRRLGEVLNGKDATKPFTHLSEKDKLTLREILHETKPETAPFLTITR